MPGARAGMGRSVQSPAGVSGIVNAQQLIVVTLVGTRIGRWSVGIAGVIHTSSQIRVVEVGVLVIQTESMSDLLAGHQSPAGWGVILRPGAEVRVIEFHCTLDDVATCRQPDLGYAKPPGVAIGSAANFVAAARRATVTGLRTASNNLVVNHAG